MVPFSKVALIAGLALVPAFAMAQQAQPQAQQQQQIDPALKAALDATVPKANSFVTALDNKQFAQALGMTSAEFKKSLGTQKFDQVIGTFQSKNGAVKGRQIVGAGPVNPPTEANAPKGRYMAVQYQTMFANSGANVELVVLHEGTPNNWNIAGYFANPVPPQPSAAPAR